MPYGFVLRQVVRLLFVFSRYCATGKQHVRQIYCIYFSGLLSRKSAAELVLSNLPGLVCQRIMPMGSVR